jgi:ubiquinone/menaquinone biosynthesis C-methylase UbiE
MEVNDSIRSKVETKLNHSMDTVGGIGKYAYALQMPEAELIKLISNKTVLDVGSGKGGFAKECALKKIPSKVFSVNARIAFPDFREKEMAATSKITDGVDTERVQKEHDSKVVPSVAQELPFKSEAFDLVLDFMAATHYSNNDSFRTIAEEMYRVTKKGGEVIIFADFSAEFDNERMYKDRALILKELEIPYKELRHDGYGIPEGFRITKPEA